LDVEAYIGQLENLLADARPMPLSSSIIVNKREVDDVLAELRSRLPDELRQSRWIIKERDELLDAAAREAEQLMADTRAERDRMLSETEVVRAAQREAEQILADAREQASCS
jgi:cell division septum initiation protein DivIVA